MKNAIGNCRQRKAVLFALALPLMFSGSPAQAMHRSEIVMRSDTTKLEDR